MSYSEIIVESYYESGSGLRGPVHIRPLPGQEPYLSSMRVSGSKTLENDYPVGTKFRIQAKISQRQGGSFYIYTNPNWHFDVVK
jgi:hypothetical protein